MLAALQAGQVYISQNVGTKRGLTPGAAGTGACPPVAVTLNWTNSIAAKASHHPQFVVGTPMREP